MANKRTGVCGTYYGSYFNESGYLTDSERKVNATYIYKFFNNKGWTINSISAMLGNMQQESDLNPGRWQSNNIGNYSGGYGLVQWTPATNYTDWCNSNGYDASEMDSNLKRILYELENRLQWIATSSYDISFSEFTKSTASVEYLTTAFLKNYERAGAEKLENRISYAENWYTYLSNNSNTFVARTDSEGMEGSFYYYSDNPFYQSGYGLPNCTCYAWGRFWEISDPEKNKSNKPKLSLGDAEDWFSGDSVYERGQTAKLGAVVCWRKGVVGDDSDGAGHVAIVEGIDDEGNIITSNSAWNSTFFYMKTYNKSDNYNFNGYVFQGFIYNPFVSNNIDPDIPPEPPEPPEPDYPDYSRAKRKGFNFVLFNRKRRLKQWTGKNF